MPNGASFLLRFAHFSFYFYVRVPCPCSFYTHHQINMLSLDSCSRAKRAPICEIELLLSVVRGHIHKRALTTEKTEEEGWGLTTEDQHLCIPKASETLSNALIYYSFPSGTGKVVSFQANTSCITIKWNLIQEVVEVKINVLCFEYIHLNENVCYSFTLWLDLRELKENKKLPIDSIKLL